MINEIIFHISEVLFPYSLYVILATASYFEPKFNLFVLLFIMSIIGVLRTISNALYIIPIAILMLVLFLRIINTRIIRFHALDSVKLLLLIFLVHRTVYFILARYFGFGGITSISSMAIFIFSIIWYYLCFDGLKTRILKAKYIESLVIFILILVFISTFINSLINNNFSVEFGPQILGVNSNNFGALYSGILLFFLIRNHNTLTKLKNITIILIFFFAIFFSQSRAAVVAFLFSYTLFLLQYKKVSKFIFHSILVILIFFIVFQYMQLPIVNKFKIIEEAYYSRNAVLLTSGRYNMIVGALKYLADGGLPRILFGGGLGSFRKVSWYYYNLYGLTSSVHNHFFDLLTKFGIIGLVIYLSIIIKITFDSYKYYKFANDTFSAGVFFLMVNYFICDMFGNRFTGISMFFIWPLIAVFYFRKYRGINMEIVKRKNDYTCANTS